MRGFLSTHMTPLAAAMEEKPVHSIDDADTVAVFINELAERASNIPRNKVAELTWIGVML